MVCVHCGKATKVVNSRLQRRSNQVWRRRRCIGCRAVFTTEESVDYETAWTVKNKAGSYRPFSADKLLLSLYRSLEHRQAALGEATELKQTIIKRLRAEVDSGTTTNGQIREAAQVALTRFDKAAATHYEAHHRQSA